MLMVKSNTLKVDKMRFLKVEDIKESGYYWWLPQYLMDEPGNANNWQVIFVTTVDPPQFRKVGVFVGPLFPPLSEGVV